MAEEQDNVKQASAGAGQAMVKTTLVRRQQGVEITVESADSRAAFDALAALIEAIDMADMRGYQDGTKNKKRASLHEEELGKEVKNRSRARYFAMKQRGGE